MPNNKVWVVQRPKFSDNFDFEAINRLGADYEYLLPSAPNMLDRERMEDDTERMRIAIQQASPADVFITLGGSPIAQMMFGAAFATSGVDTINYGLYSRPQDHDGRRGGRGQRGSYRVIPVSLLRR